MAQSMLMRGAAGKAIKWIGAAVLLSSGVALAASPHFIRANASVENDGDLLVSFKVAGLDDNQSLTVIASADATALYACRNHGQNFPSDPKKQEVTGPVWASDDFTSGKNGQITNALLLSPPESTLECPPGQRAVLVSVEYTGVIVDGGVAGLESVPGRFERIYYNLERHPL